MLGRAGGQDEAGRARRTRRHRAEKSLCLPWLPRSAGNGFLLLHKVAPLARPQQKQQSGHRARRGSAAMCSRRMRACNSHEQTGGFSPGLFSASWDKENGAASLLASRLCACGHTDASSWFSPRTTIGKPLHTRQSRREPAARVFLLEVNFQVATSEEKD